jgi:hypothetical protein
MVKLKKKKNKFQKLTKIKTNRNNNKKEDRIKRKITRRANLQI